MGPWAVTDQPKNNKTIFTFKILIKKLGILVKIKQAITSGLSLYPCLSHGKAVNLEKGTVAYRGLILVNAHSGYKSLDNPY